MIRQDVMDLEDTGQWSETAGPFSAIGKLKVGGIVSSVRRTHIQVDLRHHDKGGCLRGASAA